MCVAIGSYDSCRSWIFDFILLLQALGLVLILLDFTIFGNIINEAAVVIGVVAGLLGAFFVVLIVAAEKVILVRLTFSSISALVVA